MRNQIPPELSPLTSTWSPSLKGAFVQVNANNLGDRAFLSGCYGTGNCYWGAGRSVIATVGYDF